jgi:integrase
MYPDKNRWSLHGTISLISVDQNGKKIRVPKEKIPSYVKTLEDAENYCKSVAAERDAARIRAERRVEWQNRHFNFSELMDEYAIDRKKKAPNSWENDLYYTRAYVLPFFLNEAKQPSPLLWSDHYYDFKNWLEKVEPVNNKGGKKTSISVSTQNHCIKALNNFLSFMMEMKRMESVTICKPHPRSKVNRKTIENVMSKEVQDKIHRELLTIDKLSADFFRLLNATGMREGEALGLSKVDLFSNLTDGDAFLSAMKKHDVKSYGFIVLESQLASTVKVRETDGSVRRRPLKRRKKISREEGRTIPILSAEVWDMLVARWEIQDEKFQQRVYGVEERNYLLFEGLNKNRFYRHIKEACRKARVREHSPHDSRHTFSTEFVGLFECDLNLARLVLGHRDQRETLGYTHLFNQIQLEKARAMQQVQGLRRSTGELAGGRLSAAAADSA